MGNDDRSYQLKIDTNGGFTVKKRSFEQQMRVDQQNWYDAMHTTQVKLKLNNKTDADILDWIWRQRIGRNTSVQGEIKRLIRQEIGARG